MGLTPGFAHLSVRSSYSLRDGAIRPRELAAAAALKGMSHVALTDRDGLYGAVRFAQACEATGVRPVFGADLALAPGGWPGWGLTRGGRSARYRTSTPSRGPAWLEDDAPRVVLLARDQGGYGALCRAVSAAHAWTDDRGRFERASPHLAWEHATVATDGLVVLLGVDSPFGRLVAAGRVDDAAAEARRWVEAFGRDQVVIGVRHHLERDDDVRTGRTVDLADRLGLTAAAVNDVRYLEEQDVVLADVLACVRGQTAITANNVGRRTAEGWLKSALDLSRIALFRDRPDLLTNAQRIAESCEVDLDLHRTHVPRLTGLSDSEARHVLHTRCRVGIAQRFGGVTPKIEDRLVAELAMIDQLGLHDYFLTVAQIVDGIREMGVLCACRGSAAGSLVCYALRISDVDPVEHGLSFERFMNPYRDELPDIDVDVESARREDVYRMVIGRFGEERTACVAMVETFQARMAVREVGKALGLPPAEIDLVAKAFRRVRAKDVRQAMATLPELKNSRIDAGQLETLFHVVERIDGFPRHLALHPCGIVLADTHLQDRTPVERSAHGFSMVQFDKDDVAAMGLLKLDVLAIRLLSGMRHALDLLPGTRGIELDFHEIPDEDPAVYDLLATTRSVGVFQIESPGQREILGRMQPDHFGDLIAEISLFRPGPVKANMVTPFVARRRGLEPAVHPHPLLEPVLAETFGVVVYHEQVMGVVAALTGCDLSFADLIRRQLNDDTKLPELRAWAIGKGMERGLPKAEAEAVWQQVESFASFGFCKAHAAAFAVPTYRSAWLKTHYLPELFAGLLTHDPGMYPRRLILDEARNFGVAVLPPDVNLSSAAYTVERICEEVADHLLELDGWREGGALAAGWKPGEEAGSHPVPPSRIDAGVAGDGTRWALRIALQDVRGMSAGERERLLGARPYDSLDDLRLRGGISRPTAEALCKAGALDALGGGGTRGRRVLRLRVEELWAGRGKRVRPAAAVTAHGASSELRRVVPEVHQVGFDLNADHRLRLPELADAEVVRAELEVMGMDVSRHLVSFYEPLFPVLEIVRAVDLLEGAPGTEDGRRIKVAGVRVALQSPPVKSQQRVLFLSLDDRTGTVQANFFERVLDRCAWTLLNAWLVVVEGRVRRNGPRGVTVLADKAWDLTKLWRAWQDGDLQRAVAMHGDPQTHERQATNLPGLAAAEFGRGSR